MFNKIDQGYSSCLELTNKRQNSLHQLDEYIYLRKLEFFNLTYFIPSTSLALFSGDIYKISIKTDSVFIVGFHFTVYLQTIIIFKLSVSFRLLYISKKTQKQYC